MQVIHKMMYHVAMTRRLVTQAHHLHRLHCLLQRNNLVWHLPQRLAGQLQRRLCRRRHRCSRPLRLAPAASIPLLLLLLRMLSIYALLVQMLRLLLLTWPRPSLWCSRALHPGLPAVLRFAFRPQLLRKAWVPGALPGGTARRQLAGGGSARQDASKRWVG